MLLSLWPLRLVANRLTGRFRPEEGRLAVELPAGASAASLLEAVEATGARVSSLEFEEEGDTRRVDMRVRIEHDRPATALLDALTRIEDVKGARWNP